MFSSSKSSSSDQRIAATDDAQVASRNSSILNPNSRGALGKNSEYVESGSVSLDKGASFNAGISLSSAKGGTVTYNTTQGVEALSAEYAKTINKFADGSQAMMKSLMDTTKAIDASNSDLTKAVTQQLSSVSETKLTDGKSNDNKTVLWAVLGVVGLVVVGVYFLFRGE